MFAISFVTGCATPPAPVTAGPSSAAAASAAPSPCPAVSCPACAERPPPEIAPTAATLAPSPEAPRGRLERSSWDFVSGFANDDVAAALPAFIHGCAVLEADDAWAAACRRARLLGQPDASAMRAFLTEHFEPYRVVNADDTDQGIVTGYYEPLLRGNRVKTNVYKYPIYATPNDLITVDLSALHPDLKHRRLRGRIVANKLVPYYERAEIESGAIPFGGLELAWVDNAVDLFFLHIQGSGQIAFPDGSKLRVGYADQNGHPFRSTAGALIRAGQLRASQASMQGIKAWAAANPKRVPEFLNRNPSYVFFKELPTDLPGPIGTLGVPLTAERSIAVDQRVVPLGAPVFLSTTFPGSKTALNRLVMAQDTGGAIAGGMRVDYFWGFGDEAGLTAGKMKQMGRMWVLLPKGMPPPNPSDASNTSKPDK